MHQGRLEQVGSPLEVFDRPRTAFCASFIGSPAMNLLKGCVSSGIFTCGPLRVAQAPLCEGEVVLGVRPHQVAEGTGQSAPVSYVERLGSQTIIDCDLGGAVLRIAREGDHGVRTGSRLAFDLPPGSLHWFDARTGLRL